MRKKVKHQIKRLERDVECYREQIKLLSEIQELDCKTQEQFKKGVSTLVENLLKNSGFRISKISLIWMAFNFSYGSSPVKIDLESF